jgi:hypothetical protein
MDGIMTGEQHWIRTRRVPVEPSMDERGAPARRRSGSSTGDREPAPRSTDRKTRSLWRRLAAAWARGWVAFVAATGEPYMSLAGRMELRTVKESPRQERRERPEAEAAETGARPSAEPAKILEEAPALG